MVSAIVTGIAMVALALAVIASARSPDTRKPVTAKIEAAISNLRELNILGPS